MKKLVVESQIINDNLNQHNASGEPNEKILIKTEKELKVIKLTSSGKKMFSTKTHLGMEFMYLKELVFPKQNKIIEK